MKRKYELIFTNDDNKHAQHTLGIDSCIGWLLYVFFPFGTIFVIQYTLKTHHWIRDLRKAEIEAKLLHADDLCYIVAWTAQAQSAFLKNIHGKAELCRQWVLSPIGVYELGIAKWTEAGLPFKRFWWSVYKDEVYLIRSGVPCTCGQSESDELQLGFFGCRTYRAPKEFPWNLSPWQRFATGLCFGIGELGTRWGGAPWNCTICGQCDCWTLNLLTYHECDVERYILKCSQQSWLRMFLLWCCKLCFICIMYIHDCFQLSPKSSKLCCNCLLFALVFSPTKTFTRSRKHQGCSCGMLSTCPLSQLEIIVQLVQSSRHLGMPKIETFTQLWWFFISIPPAFHNCWSWPGSTHTRISICATWLCCLTLDLTNNSYGVPARSV